MVSRGVGSWQTYYQNQTPMLGSTAGPNMPRMGYIVASIQTELNHNGSQPLLTVDGEFGPLTEKSTLHFQKVEGLIADGIVGPQTARALCQLRCDEVEVQRSLPLKGILAGVIRVESSYDFGATGWVDPRDRGLAQINSSAHPDVTDTEAFDSAFSITWAGKNLQSAFKIFSDVECAIAAYNLGIGGAGTWCKDKAANPQAMAYVENVMKGP